MSKQRYHALLIPLLTSIILASNAYADRSDTDNDRSITDARVQHRQYTFPETDESIPYAVFVPTTLDAAKPAPLMVALHGLGRTYDWVMGYAGLLAEAEAGGFIVVTPLGYTRQGWYGSRKKGLDGRDLVIEGARSEADVMNVLRIARTEYNIDPNRIYLWGHSMGGGGAWHLAVKYPDIWAAVGVVAPAPPPDTPPDILAAARHIPIIAIQGTDDKLVPVATTRLWVQTMKQLGMQHLYIEITNGDHTDLILKDRQNMKKIVDFFNIVHKVY